MSNITYIETFAVDSANIIILKNTSGDITARNTNKVSALKTEIDKLNAQFIRYFETIMIKLPTSDSHDFYKEITSVINADIENKTYLDKILDFNKSQGNTNMDTLKYELENNKLYILTLLISSIIFIGLYNIYINYIDNEKYLSLMIFIAIIIFIVIGSYYIINSNRRVRTIHKNIYWGPQSSESF
jgi:NAD/NADP transhydrogenase beta subunit